MPASNPANRAFTFDRVRRGVMAALGILLVGKGFFEHQWVTAILGVAIVAYGMLAPG
jgi:hypothetical protein